MRIIYETTEAENLASEKLSEALRISKFLANLLVNREIVDEQEAANFLNPQLANLFDPFLMKDMHKAVDRIMEALSKGEKILVYGDEDVDGICATALLLDILQDLGGQVSYIIPSKADDGVGLKEKFILRAKEEGFRLIITVDCGSTNFSQVEYARSNGIDVIITDHHIPLNELPNALAVINPKRVDDSYPFKMLCGAAVAYKVGQATGMKKMNLSFGQWYSVKRQLLIHVMLGTIGDRVPLLNENRIFVKFGLEELGASKAIWVDAIGQNSRLDLKPRTITTILANFVPLLSAGESVNGRNLSCELLLSHDSQKALEWASELYLTSQEWLYRARKTYQKIRSSISCDDESNVVLIVDQEADVDVLSYSASKLKDGLNKPVIIIGLKENCLIGEARAPKGCDLMLYFKCCSEYFIDYGGHKCAAGFSSKPENLNNVINKLFEASNAVFKDKLNLIKSRLKIQIELDEINPQLISEITQLGPFGEGNPVPVFICNNIYLQRIKSGFNVPGSNIIFWATRKARHNWVFPYGQPIKVDISFFIDANGKLFIIDFSQIESIL